MAKLNKQIERVDQLCNEIAMLELDNWDVIQRFHAIDHKIQRAYRELEKLCDRGVIKRKVEEIQAAYGTPRKPRRGGLVVKRRLLGPDKARLTKEMVGYFRQQKMAKVSLDDINAWLSQPTQGDKNDLRDELLIRGITIPQVNWFHIRTKVRGKEKIIKLYDDKSYETRKAPHKSFFNVQAWWKFISRDWNVRDLIMHGEEGQ